jgi:outer membrane lipoprotein SlyB
LNWSIELKISFPLVTKAVCLFALLSSPLMAQKSGQSIQIQYGVVVASKYVQEKSNSGKGALVGGAIGLYAGKGKSSGTMFRRSTAGAVVGGATTSAVQGSRDAREYQVKTSTGVTVILSDQTQIAVDDCVIIETPNKEEMPILGVWHLLIVIPHPPRLLLNCRMKCWKRHRNVRRPRANWQLPIPMLPWIVLYVKSLFFAICKINKGCPATGQP